MTPFRPAVLAWGLLALAAVLAVPAARCAPLPQPGNVIALSIVDQDLSEVLNEIGSQAGFRVSVSGAVRGRVHGRLPATSAEALLDRLAAMFGFQWFYDGETVYVSAFSESASKLLVVTGVGAERLWHTMEQLGIADGRWPIQTAGENGLAIAKGPPRYLALMDQTLAALSPKTVTAPEVRVFRGSASSPPF